MFHALVRMVNPEGFDLEGHMFVRPNDLDWQSVPYLEPGQCEHATEMCRECVDSWQIDHEVVAPSWV